MTKIKIDIDIISDEKSILIIKHRTGIVYEMQCAGTMCEQRQVEGFAIPMGELGLDFDCCAFGCSYIGLDIDMQNNMLKSFEEYLKTQDTFYKNSFAVDWESREETAEALIPVLFSGKLQFSTEFKNAKSILYTANCD